MPSTRLDLGKLEHIYDRQNLKLTTDGFMTISSPQLFEFPVSTNFENLEALVSSSTWVAAGNQLHFLVHICFDDIMVLDSDTARVKEDLGAVLCNAEIWSQLCLKASLSLPGSGYHTSDDASDSILDQSNSVSISLTRQTSSQNITCPPDGVPIACLEVIDLTMHFSACRRRRIPLHEARLGRAIGSAAIDKSLGDEDLLESGGLPMLSHELARTNVEDRGSAWPWEPNFPVKAADDSLGLSASVSTETSRANSQNTISSKSSLSSAIESQRSVRSYSTPYCYAKNEVRFEDLVKVIDAALHTMISDHMPARYGGKGGRQTKYVPIVLSNDEGYPKLAAISPALFSTGYHEVLLQHDSLLSTIAHTICSISRHTNSMSLKRRVQQFLYLAPNRYSNTGTASSSAAGYLSPSLTSATKARLWYLIQRRLFDPFASQRLKPLDALKRSFSSGSGSQNMLDESIMHGTEVETMFDDEDTDPFAESQDYLLDDECFQVDNLFEEEDLEEPEDIDDDLLMDGEAVLHIQGADEDIFWRGLDCDEDNTYRSQPSFGRESNYTHFRDGCQMQLEARMEDILDEGTGALHEDIFAESQFRVISREDDMLEDAEMTFV